MKKAVLMGFGLLLILGCVSVGACSSGKKDGTASTPAQSPQQETTRTASSTTKPVSGSSGSFGGIPIYPGAKQMMSIVSDKDEVLNDKPAVFEHRVYTTSDKRDKVVAFYKDKMPASGWTEASWMDMGSEAMGGSIGEYDRNDGQAAAVISCTDGDKEGGVLLTMDLKYIK
jgi:hypothetical protein